MPDAKLFILSKPKEGPSLPACPAAAFPFDSAHPDATRGRRYLLHLASPLKRQSRVISMPGRILPPKAGR